MWIVKLALRLPYTFAVLSILVFILGLFTASRMPVDVLPVINIPVVTVIWAYGGITPNDMEKRFIFQSERAFTTTVNDIEHIESQSVSGIGVVKVYFQPGADLAQGIAQITASSQTILRVMPPGTTPPLIIRYDASDVPVIQLAVSGKSESQSQLFDYSQNFLRTQLAGVQGAQLPLPYGGAGRAVQVDLSLPALYAHGLSPIDVSNAISAQNLILPTGDAKIGNRDYTVQVNSAAQTIEDLNNIPIKDVNGAIITVHDVAEVRDGGSVQTNLVNRDGKPAVLLTVLKSGSASTLDVVNRIRAALPRVISTLPADLTVATLGDQSVFVKASVQSVIREAVIAACLTAAMILLFLGSVRSTAIVAVSIPLSILTSIIVLGAIGQTLNTMTLGGLALAVGILVDDTTVTIENINRYLGLGRNLRQAILEGSAEIALPALVSTLAICIVFLPVSLLTGTAKYLFVPLAESVVFAMLASYFFSRTITPTFVAVLLKNEAGLYVDEHGSENDASGTSEEGHPDEHSNGQSKRELSPEEAENVAKIKRGIAWRVHTRFNGHFERFRKRYSNNLAWTMEHRWGVALLFLAFFVISACLLPFIGRDFFPQVDAGQIRLHVRVAPSTRLEETANQFATIEARIRQTIPPSETQLVLDNIGEPISVNLAFGDTATVGPSDGEIDISLKDGHRPTQEYIAALRRDLPKAFPNDTFFFQPADIVNQILNFGLPAPIDVQVGGPLRNQVADLAIARQLRDQMVSVPGAADVHLQQITGAPALQVNVDRVRAMQVGLTQQAVADSLLVSIAGSGQAVPSYWLDPKSGVVYSIAVQTPQYALNSPDAILNTPLASSNSSLSSPELLSNIATVDHSKTDLVISHYNIQPVYDVFASAQNRDLGGIASNISTIIAKFTKHLPRGSYITMRGQVQTMNESFTNLGFGLIGSVILVYLLLTVNFQSWIDPVVVVSGVPCTLGGILWMLFITQTTLNVPSLMGCIMAIGVSTANSVLLVTFANERRLEGMSAVDAALSAGAARLRPILMTAFAMIIGMIPMALALGEGAEQNAPLGRAVIGGLLVATFTTLFFVPIIYVGLRKNQPPAVDNSDLDEFEEHPKPKPAKHQHPDKNGDGNGSDAPQHLVKRGAATAHMSEGQPEAAS